MRSAFRRLRDAATSGPPIPLSPAGRNRGRGLTFPLIGGPGGTESYLGTYKRSGTVYAIVSLLAEKAASVNWRLYKKQPRDGRRRYTTSDVGSDQRIEVVQHPALKLLTHPNDFFTRFEYMEGSNQHAELVGETFWVLDRENPLRLPTSMWYVAPHRMEPVPDADEFLLGWVYTGPDGTIVPLHRDEVILERRPDPTDPYRGCSPVAAILPNIEQQRYATEYMRNKFINGATPGGTILTDSTLSEPEFEELMDRWREAHQGIARAGAVGVLENGNRWVPDPVTNRDLEYSQLRLTNRDEIREAWRLHKSMLGNADDVNRANAETAAETFDATLIVPRLDRRRETINYKLLPMFGDDKVEFDYDSPLVPSREEENAELLTKAQALQLLISSGVDPHAAMETVGLPDMNMVPKAAPDPTPGQNRPEQMDPTEQIRQRGPGGKAGSGRVGPGELGTGDEFEDLAQLFWRDLRPFTTRALPAAAQNRRSW